MTISWFNNVNIMKKNNTHFSVLRIADEHIIVNKKKIIEL